MSYEGNESLIKDFFYRKATGETDHLEHGSVSIFLDLIQLVLYFFDIFFQKLDFLKSDLAF